MFFGELKQELANASIYADMDDVALVVKDLQAAQEALTAIHHIGAQLGFAIHVKKTNCTDGDLTSQQPPLTSKESHWPYFLQLCST